MLHKLAIVGTTALLHAGVLASPQPATCPASVPVQTITVVNEAHAKPWALAKVENAVVAQSIQLRAAWGTPCVQFGSEGWKLYLQIGTVDGAHGNHYFYGEPYGFVWTSGSPWPSWGYMFSHEVVEMLVDPTTARGVWHDDEGLTVEAVDPVEDETYRLDGVNVSDFVLPSWFAGAMQAANCQGADCTYSDPLPGSGSGAPYDFLRHLIAPWQSDSPTAVS